VIALQEANNRPFNGTNLVDDVAASFKKTLVIKSLQALTEENAITMKVTAYIKNKNGASDSVIRP